MRVGLVAIGRNEGQRLRQCLESVIGKVALIVYVDSGSSDGSVELARSLGVEVVELDLSTPFTAARARNVGFERLLQLDPSLKYVQFVDGDCEVVEGWLELAWQALEADDKGAIAYGRRRERFPQMSIYNRLCDLEWDILLNQTGVCGGDALMRVEAFQQVGGFDSTLIAGEEPELCIQVQIQGWKLVRLQADMTIHDVQMTRFSQWWRRNLRAGHAYAEGAWKHGKTSNPYWLKETLSIWLWGCLLPLLSLSLVWFSTGVSLLLLLGYVFMAYRIYHRTLQWGFASEEAVLYAIFCLLGKFPNCLGQLKFYLSQRSGQPKTLIEYK